MKPKILLAEADCMFAETVSYVLEQAGFETLTARDSRSTLHFVKEFGPDLVILSATLPAISRFQLCYELRREETAGTRVPIFVLGTDDTEDLRVSILDCGADDYLAKPFGMKEFLARVYALLRQANVALGTSQTQPIQLGEFLLHPAKNLLEIQSGSDARQLPLRPKECALLRKLMSHSRDTVAREVLIEQVWGGREAPGRPFNTLDVHIKNLRRKVEPDPGNPKHILSVRGVGFRFDP